MSQVQRIVVLDTATLVPFTLRDTLLRAAEVSLFEIYWSEDSLIELERTLVSKLKIELRKARRLIRTMQAAFSSATILESKYQPILPQMQNDPKDRHVLAAAVIANASLIVTPNLKDFPPTALQPHNIQALSPDDFLEQIFTESSATLVQVIQKQAQALKNPAMTTLEILEALKVHAPKTVALLETKVNS
jgi:predicted nucleic acid-binding protein